MGYVDPQQNIRSYVDVMNRKTQEIGDNFDLKFNELNQTMRSNIARNAARMQEEKLKKQMGLEAYYDLVGNTGAEIEGGWIDMNDNFLRNTLGDMYFDLVGKDDLESIKKRKNIEKIPQILANLQGTYKFLREDFDNSVKITGGYSGGFNPETAPRTVGFITDGNNLQYDISDEGNLLLSYDYDGEHYENVSAQEIIAMSLDGGVGILKYGNPFELRTQIHDDIWNDPSKNFSTAYLTKTQNSPADINNSETWHHFDEINQQFKDAISNENLYLGGDKTALNDADIMRGYWPVIINDAYDEYKKGNGDQYKDLLEKILPESVLGADMLLGTTDDGEMISVPQPQKGTNVIDKTTSEYDEWMNFYKVQGAAGVWDLANQDQKNLALTWFGSIDPNNKHVKESRKVTETEGANTAKNLRNRQLRQKINSGNATVQETNQLRDDIRTWLRNSHDLQTRKYADTPRLWGAHQGPATNAMIQNMSRWLNSPDGLKQFGVIPPKGGQFQIDNVGQISIIYYGDTDDNGNPKIEETQIRFEPGEKFDTKQNYNAILNYNTKQERSDANYVDNPTDDPDGLF